MKTATGSTNGVKATVEPHKWLETTWPYLVDGIAMAFRMNDTEQKRFSQSKTAQLVAFIPYAAQCKEVKRTALAHLAIYLLAARDGITRKEFDHAPCDDSDLYGRLRTISNFAKGNTDIIKHGMTVLALLALQSYNADRIKDRKTGEYNVLNAGAWDYETARNKLQMTIETTPDGGIDALVGPITPQWFWGE